MPLDRCAELRSPKVTLPLLVVPTILRILGWRIFFYPNEGNEPIHVHCQKAEKECKFWVDVAAFDLSEEFALNMSSGRQTRDSQNSF